MRRALVLVTLAALACSPGAFSASHQVETHSSILQFHPFRLNIVAGDTVSWFNESYTTNHNLRANDPPDYFPQMPLNVRTGAGPVVFPTQLEVKYECTIHPGMKATIAVWDVWVETPSIVTYGAKGRFSGEAKAGATVRVERNDGSEATPSWTPVGLPVQSSGTSGAYSISLGGLGPDTYRINDTTNDLQSRVTKLNVRPRLTVSKGKIRRGFWNVAVKATPNQKGATAVFERKKGIGWAKLGSKAFGRSSKAALKVTIPKGKSSLRVRVRLTKPQHDYSPATSASFVLKR